MCAGGFLLRVCALGLRELGGQLIGVVGEKGFVIIFCSKGMEKISTNRDAFNKIREHGFCPDWFVSSVVVCILASCKETFWDTAGM